MTRPDAENTTRTYSEAFMLQQLRLAEQYDEAERVALVSEVAEHKKARGRAYARLKRGETIWQSEYDLATEALRKAQQKLEELVVPEPVEVWLGRLERLRRVFFARSENDAG